MGTDTILLLSKHPWQAVILVWLLIRVAVPWITHPGWPWGAVGLWRCCPSVQVQCPGAVSCSLSCSLQPHQGCAVLTPSSAFSGLFHSTALLGAEGLLVGTGTALLSLSGDRQPEPAVPAVLCCGGRKGQESQFLLST